MKCRVEAGDVEVGLEALDLATVPVASHGDVERGEAALIASTVEDLTASRIIPAHVPNVGMPASMRSAIGSNSPDDVSRLRDRGGLATGHHQRVARAELLGPADLHRVDAEPAEALNVARNAPCSANTPIWLRPARLLESPPCRTGASPQNDAIRLS